MTKLLQTDSKIFNFRLADESDTDDIVALVELAYRGEKSKQGWTTEADFINGQRTDREEVSELMQKKNAEFILCFENNNLLGSVQLRKTGRTAYLGMFAVDPGRQSAGIGRLLMRQVEDFAQRQWQCHTMQMMVITIRDDLIQWYRRQGYQPTGKLEPFPYHEPRFGLPTRDDLMLEIYEKKLV